MKQAYKVYVQEMERDGKQPLANSVKKGLADAFTRFDEYSLAKYAKTGDIKLRDALFLCHAKPINQEQARLWKRLVEDKLSTPDTWEVELTASSDKRASWTRLLNENKLGGLAFLRNLRNMIQTGVDNDLIRAYFSRANFSRVLPFRFISAARHAPVFEQELEKAMFKATKGLTKLSGKTVLIVDVSGSMWFSLSSKSDLNRLDTACALAMLVRELSDDLVIYATAGSDGKRAHATENVPARRGFALVEAIHKAKDRLGGGGIFLKQVTEHVGRIEKAADRVIVISDSQDCDVNDNRSPDKANAFGEYNYLMDISSEKNGIGYNKFVVINGFSENLLEFISEYEEFDKMGNVCN